MTYNIMRNRDTLIYVCIGKALQRRLQIILSEVHIITVLRKPHFKNMIQYCSSTSKRGYNRAEIVWLKIQFKKAHTYIEFLCSTFNCVDCENSFTWSSFCTHNDWAFLAARCKAFFPTGTKQQINRSH